MSKLADYQTIGDSISLGKIDGQSFTVIKVEDSPYTSGEDITEGIKITTKESFDIEGTKMSKFHTTRIAIVRKFKNDKIRDDINKKGLNLGPIKCVKETAKNGKQFFNLVDV